jgi:hypothetical protein
MRKEARAQMDDERSVMKMNAARRGKREERKGRGGEGREKEDWSRRYDETRLATTLLPANVPPPLHPVLPLTGEAGISFSSVFTTFLFLVTCSLLLLLLLLLGWLLFIDPCCFEDAGPQAGWGIVPKHLSDSNTTTGTLDTRRGHCSC